MQGLLFYDPSAGQGEMYNTDGQGGISRTRLHTGWRPSWTQIIPGNFGGSGGSFNTDLLFYDASAGTGEFYLVNPQGGIDLLGETYTDWRSSWTQIIPGSFGGSGGSAFTDLLFYDAAAGTGEFHTTDGLGGLALLRSNTDWNTTWTQIIPGNFGGSSFTDLLFYDAAAGTGEFYTTDGQGVIAALGGTYTDWRSSWTQIIPGNFGGSGFTDLLFYDAAAGTGEFYTTDGQGGLALLRSNTDWNTTWTQIIPGNFGGSGFTDLLFYDAAAGTAQFYTTDGQGVIAALGGTYTDWRSSWARIIPGQFAHSRISVRIHVKSLLPITPNITQFINDQFSAMEVLFSTVGINVVQLTTEDLSGDPNLVPLQNLDIGACRGTPTQEQITLFAQRNNVRANELVIYICQTLIDTTPPTGNTVGCATHPAGQPGAAVVQVSVNDKWLTAHEVGHVLDLEHVCSTTAGTCKPGHSDSLMFPNIDWTNEPPNLSLAEERRMVASSYTNTG